MGQRRRGRKPGGDKSGGDRGDARPTHRPQRGELVVNGYSEQWLRKGFPWVYPAEVVARGKGGQGQVRLVSGRGEFLGLGLADEGWIAARVYRRSEGALDRAWLWAALDQAAALRERVIGPDTNGYRLVHGENDDLPGLRVDWWSHYAVIILDSPAVAALVPQVVAWHHQPVRAYEAENDEITTLVGVLRVADRMCECFEADEPIDARALAKGADGATIGLRASTILGAIDRIGEARSEALALFAG